MKFENYFSLIQVHLEAIQLPRPRLVVGRQHHHHLSQLALPPPLHHPLLHLHLLSLPHHHPIHHHSLLQMCHSFVLHFLSCLSVSIYTRDCQFFLLIILCHFLCLYHPCKIIAMSFNKSSELTANIHSVIYMSTSCGNCSLSLFW
jgi:hypothetical protein